MSVTKARSRLADLTGSHERTCLTRKGEPAAVLMSFEDYESLRAIQHLAADPERLMELTRRARDFEAGRLEEFVELDADGAMKPAPAPLPRAAARRVVKRK